MSTRMWFLPFGCLLLSCVLASACPPAQLLRPCRCNYIAVECEGIKEQGILDGVFRRLGNHRVNEFILRNSKVEYIPAFSVKRNAFKKVQIVDSVMSKLFETDPSSSNGLVHLALENVNISSGLNFGYFKPLQKLEILYIRNTVVPELGKEFSQSLSQVIRVVALWHTKTRSIDYAFLGKPKLEEVKVENSSLTSLLRTSFPFPATNLQKLSFDGNQLETFPADQFESMSELNSLSLASNKITTVSENVFGKVYDQLEYFNLDDNPINCDHTIRWITLRNHEGKIVTGKCVEPASLRGTNIIDLKPSELPIC